jgi:hypothetical protein
MNGPPRLLDEPRDDLAVQLLRSARGDAPTEQSRSRALATAAVASGAGGAAVGASLASKTYAFLRWLGLGALGGTLTAAAISHFAAGSGSSAKRAVGAMTEHGSAAAPASESPPQRARAARATEPSTRVHVASVAAKPVTRSPAASSDAAITRDRTTAAGGAPADSARAAFAPLAPATSAASHDTFAAELAQIDAARRALARGDANGALRLIAHYELSYPAPHFDQEATVVRIEALKLSGRAATAERVGRAFIAAHPDSALAPRVRTLIGAPP